jgi:hypothetical protein
MDLADLGARSGLVPTDPRRSHASPDVTVLESLDERGITFTL